MDKIICFGKNYLDHALELGDAVPDRPVLFLKPPSILLQSSSSPAKITAPLPTHSGAVHHETEIVLRLKSGGTLLTLDQAQSSIEAVTLGLDMTLRDIQTQLKKKGHPWEIAKVFPGSAITGPWLPFSEFQTLKEEEFSLQIGSKLRQKGKVSDMRLSIEECVVMASQHFPLCAGDLIFTGTPAGVGPVLPGDCATLRWGPNVQLDVSWT